MAVDIPFGAYLTSVPRLHDANDEYLRELMEYPAGALRCERGMSTLRIRVRVRVRVRFVKLEADSSDCP